MIEKKMKRLHTFAMTILVLISALTFFPGYSQTKENLEKSKKISSKHYFPGPGDKWQRKNPKDMGVDPEKLKKALDLLEKYPTSVPIIVFKELP